MLFGYMGPCSSSKSSHDRDGEARGPISSISSRIFTARIAVAIRDPYVRYPYFNYLT